MLSSVEQAFVGREEKRAPLKTPAWEASGWVKGGIFRHLDYVTEASSPGDFGIK